MSAPGTRKRTPQLDTAKDSVKESATRQIREVGTVAQDAVVSGAWAYPLYGIYYLFSHPSLLKPLLPTLFKGVLVSLGVVVGMFVFTYLPQVAVLAFVSGPLGESCHSGQKLTLAFIAAVPLVLGEAYVVVNFVAKSFLLGQAGIDLFDAVLVQKGQSTLVEKGRQVSSSGGTGKQLGKILTKPLGRFSTDNMVRYVLSLPLNLIPVVGTVFFLGYNGFKAGPGHHARYFQLKGYDKEKRQSVISKRRGAYTAFGTMGMVLNLIPVVSILFAFTTSVGAALWAADIEKGGRPGDVQEPIVDVALPPQGKKEL